MPIYRTGRQYGWFAKQPCHCHLDICLPTERYVNATSSWSCQSLTDILILLDIGYQWEILTIFASFLGPAEGTLYPIAITSHLSNRISHAATS